MPSMTKRVNVVTKVAVRNVNPPISGSYKNIIMSTSDILKLLSKRAMVEEILPDGSTVKLTMRNYYTDNGAGLDAYAGVNMDDKYNTDKDSKKNRGPLVHKAKPATPPTPPVKPITEPAHIEVEEVSEVIVEEEKEAEGTEEVMEGIEAPITLEEHEDAEEVEASLEPIQDETENIEESEEDSYEEDDDEEYEEEEVTEEVQTTVPSNNSNSNNYHHKKKKKKR